MLSALSKACVVILLSGNCAFAQSGSDRARGWNVEDVGDHVGQGLPSPAPTGYFRSRAGAAPRSCRKERSRRPPPRSRSGMPARPAIDGSTGQQSLSPGPADRPMRIRIYTYLTMAMYDATIAAWESKYFYNRPRPSEADATLATALPRPEVPPIPLNTRQLPEPPRRFFPISSRTRRRHSRRWPKRQRSSRVHAGVQFPSDSSAGLELGSEGGRAGHCTGKGRRLGRRLDGDGSDRPLHVGRRQARQCNHAQLEADPAGRTR